LTGQENADIGFEAIKGQHQVYFNRSEELMPNEYLRKAVVKGIIPSERKFWNGDLFIIELATRFVNPPELPGQTSSLSGQRKKMEVDSDEKGHTMYQDVSSH
jgi:hypothetical protein